MSTVVAHFWQGLERGTRGMTLDQAAGILTPEQYDELVTTGTTMHGWEDFHYVPEGAVKPAPRWEHTHDWEPVPGGRDELCRSCDATSPTFAEFGKILGA